jgi:hypothetical protein
MAWGGLLFVFATLAMVLLSGAVGGVNAVWHTQAKIGKYRNNQRFRMQCLLPEAVLATLKTEGDSAPARSEDGRWVEAWECEETGFPVGFEFGRDKFIYCGLKLNAAWYAYVRELLKNEEAMMCRVGMDADDKYHLPVAITLCGLLEEDHIHINYHHQFVFHADDGLILGMAMYPARDRFQAVKEGSILNFHGPVRWFARHSYTPLSGSDVSSPSVAGAGASIVRTGAQKGGFMWMLMYSVFLVTTVFVLLTLLYVLKLKPDLLRHLKYMKRD